MPTQRFQDMLNLLSIWFRHGDLPEVYSALVAVERYNINTVALDCWLGVVTQLMACMNHKDLRCREALHTLLMRLGRKHPQVGYGTFGLRPVDWLNFVLLPSYWSIQFLHPIKF